MCIIINRGSVDATPLYTKCFQNHPEVTIEPKEKEKKEKQIQYQIAGELIDKINVNSIHGLAQRIKIMLNGGATGIEITKMINYLDSWQETKSKDGVKYPVQLSLLTVENYKKWVEKGKPESFISKKKKVFTSIG